MPQRPLNSRIHKRDENQSEIKSTLEDLGYKVYDTSAVGDGFPDLHVVSKSKLTALFEVKMPGKKLNKNEMEVFDEYRSFIYIVHSPEEALEYLSWLDQGKIVLPVRKELP